jgi:hypothetical protein
MSDRTTRILALLALVMSVIAAFIAMRALSVAERREQELERLGSMIERAMRVAPAPSGLPPATLDPGE